MNEHAAAFPRLEALLFSYGEPMKMDRIAKLLDLKKEECGELVAAWQAALAGDTARGLTLIVHDGAVQLATKPEEKQVGEKLLQEEFREELSPAGLETLSLIAYLGPVPRATVDYIRGVNSSFTVRNLLVRGLVERHAVEGKGNAFHYLPSFQFLKHLGLTRIEELPEYERFHSALERIEVAAGTEESAPAQASAPDATVPQP
ncbi:MAG: SMC-Scp complex subunit ScpB [Candidatus Jorgensenbacteria bacterium]